jgi:hypothetical protein
MVDFAIAYCRKSLDLILECVQLETIQCRTGNCEDLGEKVEIVTAIAIAESALWKGFRRDKVFGGYQHSSIPHRTI